MLLEGVNYREVVLSRRVHTVAAVGESTAVPSPRHPSPVLLSVLSPRTPVYSSGRKKAPPNFRLRCLVTTAQKKHKNFSQGV